MISDVTHATVLVRETDEALDWYTGTLGFELRNDEEFGPGMRWVTVAPENGTTELVLQEPDAEVHGEERAKKMRDQIGAAPTTVLAVDDCRSTVAELEDNGVEVTTQPEEVPWGVHANIVDLYGNPYNLVENR